MKIAIFGLGRMGSQIARKLHEGGHEIIAANRSRGPVDEMKNLGMMVAYTKEEVVNLFGDEQIIIWLMVPSDVVDSELDIWLDLIPRRSILIDGGNSKWSDTREMAKKVLKKGSQLLDIGTSGGVWGYQNGFSMMVGGDSASFEIIKPFLETLKAPTGDYQYFGNNGSGHYVKMVHNAIEYGMMESLAEGYRLLKEGPYKDLDLYKAGVVWQKRSVITSWLNELVRDIMKDNPNQDGVGGEVAESGEARWALEVAKEFNIEAPAIQSSFDVRLDSEKGKVNFATKLLASMRNAFGGHKINN
ncbi:MAG: 6-phosphogluconate dehydrogenase, decarboxylating [Candidatus Nomurabacteria bacterium GW2011_GWF2_35_66]|uniref:6-phosphogluconate dehydrogenase, decarboxylating n=1 Tax=Candidatus Nomurabacteria bacterium GW2011_GWE1_35_16 TaxID=1618761 RepID=A0A0G0BBY6_9BACT|nr:MAG: 6-phosphogluconate dehydrogenase, decarboxylating [Candidatus Nomurabacteria bacterium GW2011_GWF1_34_20]KKP63662.1 MAG: 6-phosphogluconate dehydrogenase, decarboxylating [Candidatus Nomurabacteria bacterium GW2011_GWE2_34_25]KKP66864.1 MAG: 6-phosphogluconate dehydrogenase, decarboxylating [Candidatus Nomurabacteria bacterium GW2011_GWE1_35_16]KKP83490.1 MAG: 6-phosphogluconate dehydrogenase, decarboxylating [Candidatus Nomurabacteria bacterium GW2011_GWF2_35_66]HAE36578.1 6-phosphoglu